MDKYLDIKNCSCEKSLIDKLVLACEDEILNATENSLDDKKITCKKNTRFIHTISLVIACLLLLHRILEKTKRFITILNHK